MNRIAIWIILVAAGTTSWAQQTAVPRIDLMPDLPSPLVMRDWKSVVLGYDSLAFNEGVSGAYLPVVTVVPNGVNFPFSPAFRIHPYVGTNYPSISEAINALPALVGATLAGHDMRTFFGRDWVTMSRDWFNNRPAENVYLNGPVVTSGDDWWYETMPNVFFYQLSSLYPPSAEVDRQFRLVADRWWTASRAMGGRIAPWSTPGFSHRAWRLSTMTANDVGVPEPEAAGAIGWIMYAAFVTTGEPRYRVGAEWAMDALNALSSNPSYELQLSYGVQTAARMNAELGTNYDLAKLLGWCFDVGPLRSWGAIVGSRGGRDYSGLIGEVNGVNDYAFALNTFQQIAALAPVARYDERFARALGKWILNASNAARMFYSSYLPDSLQDGRAWARNNDPRSVVAYEALRQSVQGAGPFATGDAMAGGWAATNLSLYSSSSVGYLAAVVDSTDVPGILRLNLLTTDFYRAPAYPTYLLYNPYSETRSVTLAVGDSLTNIYDVVTNTNLASLVSGASSIV
ncbi:MAG: laminin G, partial [Bacteroidota bacterium]